MIDLDSLNRPYNDYKSYWYTINFGIIDERYFVLDITPSAGNILIEPLLREEVYYNPRFELFFKNFLKLGKTLETIAYSHKNPNLFFIELQQIDAIAIQETLNKLAMDGVELSEFSRMLKIILPEFTLTYLPVNRPCCELEGFDCDLEKNVFYPYNDCPNRSSIYYIEAVTTGENACLRSFINKIEQIDNKKLISDVSDASTNWLNIMIVRKREVYGPYKLYGSVSRIGGYYYMELFDEDANRIAQGIKENEENLRNGLGGSMNTSYANFQNYALYEIQNSAGTILTNTGDDCPCKN